ncbi:hypothetical protein GPJ56_008869 [Histomonas meleagridis]|uniref:uncharacterized protein n=1 Tax=Histomonas meleagridis TaxID=135588 RepID=UPI003559A12F|nr:hypothetical protein GPJ56_008869 [Histomonas meleagridis]KAH0797795.1 hypothetical protein GO595_009424 [Histomonas meleagridis]
MPDYIFYANTSQFNYMPTTEWLEEATSHLCDNDFDILFGGKSSYHNVDVGIGFAIIRSTLVRELLYYTNSTFDSIPPLLSLSLLKSRNPKIRSFYYLFEGIKPDANYDYLDAKPLQVPQPQKCPTVNVLSPTIGLLLPQFKRKHIYKFITDYEKQTLLPEFYCILQCENRITLNIDKIRSKSTRPIYHIWGYNWSPLFLFPVYISGFFPVDFVMRWDDDQSPIDINTHLNMMNEIKDIDALIGMGGFIYNKTNRVCGIDHVSVPLMYRPFHAKLTARLRPYTLAQGEDITLSLSSSLVCNSTKKAKKFKHKSYQNDLNKQAFDLKLNRLAENRDGNLFNNIYNYFMKVGGYVPTCYGNISKDAYKNIEFEHSDFYGIN